MKKILVVSALFGFLSTGCSKDPISDPVPPPPEPIRPAAKITVSPAADTVDYLGKSTITWSVSDADAVTRNGVSVALTGQLVLDQLTKDTAITFIAKGSGKPDTVIVPVRVLNQDYTLLYAKPWKILSKTDSTQTGPHVYTVQSCWADNLLYFYKNYTCIEKHLGVSCESSEVDAWAPVKLQYVEGKKMLTIGLVEYEIRELTAERLVLAEIAKNLIPGQPDITLFFTYGH